MTHSAARLTPRLMRWRLVGLLALTAVFIATLADHVLGAPPIGVGTFSGEIKQPPLV